MHYTREESGKETLWSQTLKIWEMDASELHARRLNAKEVLTPQRSGNFIFPVADGTVKLSEGEQDLRTSTLTRDRPERGEEQDILQGKSDKLHFPTPDGERELSDAWTGFSRFVLLKERPPEGHTRSGRRLTRKQTTSRPADVWPGMWKYMSDAAKKRAKQRWAIEKQNSKTPDN